MRGSIFKMLLKKYLLAPESIGLQVYLAGKNCYFWVFSAVFER